VNGAHHAGKGEFQGKIQSADIAPVTVQEAVQHAQLMVRDGGGEMKVKLRPDGLGEISMRVQVENGKVSVHMVTESDEAKKLMERSLGDLKAGLAQNNLHVDAIKIDTATNLGKQLDQQYHEAQRQAAHQNLEQFRQDQQGWRRSFFELPTVRPYSSQGDAPRDVHAPNNAAASNKRGNSRRLDLVA
jgi:flagellar hook-length control protein FliK